MLYYLYVEKIPYPLLVHNEANLFLFITYWHLMAMNFKIIEHSRREKIQIEKPARAFMIIFLAFIIMGQFLAKPILHCIKSPLVRFDSDIFYMRHVYQFLYILINILICVFPLVNNFAFFISDSIILSQLTSIYMANEHSMSALLASLPIMFAVQGH